MKFELNNIKPFVSIIDTANKILDEIKLECDSEGVRFNGLSREHITFFGMNMNKYYFDDYKITEPETVMCDTNDLLKVLKRAKSDDTLVFETDESNVIINFIGEANRTFKIRQISIEYESPSAPKLNHPFIAEVQFKDFQDSIKDSELASGKFYLSNVGREVYIESIGDLGEYRGNIDASTDNDGVNDYKSVYSIEKIKELFSCNINPFCTLCFGTDMPLSVILKSFDENLTVHYLLAPRIENR